MGFVVLAVLVLGLVGTGLYVIGLYNGLVALKHAVDQAWANVDVLLRQRSDELPKLVDAVKGHMKQEREVLERVVAARTAFDRASSVAEKSAADVTLRDAVGRLFAVAEAYPELRSSESFRGLQERISTLEEGIADRREFFNHSVNGLNVRIEQIPDAFLASAMGLRARTLFRASEEEKQDVKIAFE